MTDRDELVHRIADDVKALTEPRRHVEPYRHQPLGTRKIRWMGHTTHQPSLLDQLREGGAPAAGETGSSRGFESRPPHEQNAFDCFDRYTTIEATAAWWISMAWRLAPRPDVKANLRHIVGLATHARTEPADVQDVARDIGRWKTWAEVLTGWKTPPWTPRATCPHCERRGDLRIRLDDRQATCLNCGSAWDHGSIGVLAEHIRTEGEREIRDTPSERVG